MEIDHLAFTLLTILKKASQKKDPWAYIQGALDQLPTSQKKAAIGFKLPTPQRRRRK